MPVIENIPDLSHWRTIQEFTIEQAALLLAAIDPYDLDDGLKTVRNIRHERWKLAWGLSEGMVSAIRRGVLTTVVCVGESTTFSSYDNEYYTNYENIKPADRSKEICKSKTIITRDSLYLWVDVENVDYVRRPSRNNKVINKNNWSAESSEAVIDIGERGTNTLSEPVLLPRYEHQSEGLDFVEEAVKQFWSTYDPEDKSTAPNRDEVRDYLISQGATANLAKAVDEVLRPFDLKKGGRKPLKSTS